MRTNYVLIDFENVQPESLAALAHDDFKVVVFVGASQSKLPFEIAASIQRLGSGAEYVRVSGHGRNALDFHIAYYLGKLATADATPYFHIISNDSGFDPLIQYLKSQRVFARRVKSIAEIPLVRARTAKSPAERLAVALDWLQQTRASKPRTVKTLCSSIHSLFHKQLSDEDVLAIVKQLDNQGHLSVVGTKITYPV